MPVRLRLISLLRADLRRESGPRRRLIGAPIELRLVVNSLGQLANLMRLLNERIEVGSGLLVRVGL
jgi:hypothetical protein